MQSNEIKFKYPRKNNYFSLERVFCLGNKFYVISIGSVFSSRKGAIFDERLEISEELFFFLVSRKGAKRRKGDLITHYS